MKGFKDKNKKFHPIKDSSGISEKDFENKPQRTNGFMIGGRGALLKPIFTNVIPLEENASYWMGASSDPQHIVVTKITPDKIYYRGSLTGFKKEGMIERGAGESLIRDGLETRKEYLEKLLMTYGKEYGHKLEWAKRDLEGIERMLDGEKSGILPTDYRDLQTIEVVVKNASNPNDNDKLWYQAEEYGGVGGLHSGGYEIRMDREKLKQLKNDKRFKVVEVREIDRE